MGIIIGVIGVVTLVIGVVIVDQVIKDQSASWKSTLTSTIAQYLPVIMVLSGLALAGMIAMGNQ